MINVVQFLWKKANLHFTRPIQKLLERCLSHLALEIVRAFSSSIVNNLALAFVNIDSVMIIKFPIDLDNIPVFKRLRR